MARYLELRRHTDNDGDTLTDEGIKAALAIGRDLSNVYDVLVSSGAQRATQALGCMLAGGGQIVPGGVRVEPQMRSRREEEWRAAYAKAGSAQLSALRAAEPELVEQDSAVLAEALLRILQSLPPGGRALAVGHSPTNEAAVFGPPGPKSRRSARVRACW
jgi:broad specificity phosphatase PhoE